MRKVIGLLSVLLCVVVCSAAYAEQRAFGVELCSDIVEYQGEAYFCGKHRRLGRELFRSNGTPEGTFVVADIDTGPGDSKPATLFTLRGHLFFFAETTLLGRELWRTDGTPDGTKLIKDTVPGPDGTPSTIFFLLQGENVAYFEGEGGIWRTDGTSDGTVLLGPLGGGNVLGIYDNSVYYRAYSSTELGSDLLLQRIRENNTTPELIKNFGSECSFLSKERFGNNIANDLLFLECVGDSNSIISTDGSAAGTRTVIDAETSYVGQLDDRRYYFNFETRKIVHTNGVNTGVLGLCADVGCPLGIINILRPNLDGQLLFNLFDLSRRSNQLWSTDGSLIGTEKLSSVGAAQITAAGSRAVYKESAGNRLWVTNGTAAGTRQLVNIGNNLRVQIKQRGTDFIFLTQARFNGAIKIWSSNGSPSGTTVLRQVTGRFNNGRTMTEGERVYFSIDDWLWHTDGTQGGTYRITYLDEVSTPPRTDEAAFFMYPLLDLLLEDE